MTSGRAPLAIPDGGMLVPSIYNNKVWAQSCFPVSSVIETWEEGMAQSVKKWKYIGC